MKKNLEIAMQRLLDLRIKYCDVCGNERIKVTAEQSPDEVKELVALFGKDSKILYCEKCQEYGVIGSAESSF